MWHANIMLKMSKFEMFCCKSNLVLFILVIVKVIVSVHGSDTPSTKPNIIFILADDAGWNDFSFHGSPQIPTPNIDALAFSGTVLNSYYASPLCTPSRGAIFTGKHPIHLGLQHYVIRGDTADGLPLSEKLLPEYLKDLGYSTHLVGKWHLGHSTKLFSPTFRGFDTHYGCWLGYQDYYDHTSQDAGYWGFDFRDGMNVNNQTFGFYNTDLFTNEAKRLIQQQPTDKPMFLMVSHTAPHAGSDYDPLQAPQENVDKFRESIEDINRRKYAAMVDKLDESVGIIVKELGKRELLNNSVIIFASDNGAAPEGNVKITFHDNNNNCQKRSRGADGFNLNYGSNWPLRGVKNTLWEGGTKLAACIWSSNIQNRVSAEIMHASDWLPTLYEAAGGNVTDLGGIDGVSQWQTLTSKIPSALPRRQFLYNIDDVYNNSAIRLDSWKLIQGNTSSSDWGIRDGWYGYYPYNSTTADLIPKILSSEVARAFESIGFNMQPDIVLNLQNEAKVLCNDSIVAGVPCDPYAGPCLFNIDDDPCEQNNLATQQEEIVHQLLQLLKSYNSTARDIIDLAHHPEAAPRNWGYVWTNWKDYE